ncbi:MAG: CPBP family intramembrane metalloprotease, partial [candidate division Zixibacteria bacterium]|nr:CPBP family intramembrane metalloprotease [candidate division Zixibacteria bacterium]
MLGNISFLERSNGVTRKHDDAMNIATEQLFTNVKPQTILGRIIQFPLTRFVLVLAFLAPVSLAVMALDPGLETSTPLTKSLVAVCAAVLMYLAYCLYTRLVEKRKALEMTLKGSPAEFGKGLAIGSGLMITIVALLAVAGCYRIDEYSFDLSLLVAAFLRLGFGAFIEELVFRLIVFKLTEEVLGSWVALVVQAALFGAAHIGNPNASIFSSAAIVVEAGVLLAAAFMVTRRVWLIFGLHLAWNFVQSTVFGLSVSGTTSHGIITPIVSGPEWLTGGAFGVEASWPAVGLCLAVGLLFLRRAVKGGQLAPPVWRRRRQRSFFT